MADLGNLFFRLGIKDDEAQKVLDKLEKRLVQDGYKIKLRAPNATEFLSDLRQQLKSQTLDVKVKAIGMGTTGAVTTPADLRYAKMLSVQQAMANAAAMAQQKLTSERNRDARAAEIHTARITKNNEALSSANKSMLNQSRLLSGLRNQIMDVYSVYTMERFLKSVIEIGGEFQKQHIALNAMLGDAAKADVMFGKIKELAIESPFNFRELMGFTKQIAAFGIPYDEMYETTKRLADISAGLGVDMGRIILAYGQVRSAAFLRGQELRQFTEAGIPLVDELAKKFSELEGRVVSAGEVFEKISKREVSFGMVKDVLWKLTNEGGKFYNMQEVLTESLSGKLAKLKDSWEIMLSTIAEGNSGTLGGALDMLTKFTEKWQEVWNIIKSLGAAYLTYKGALMLASAVKAIMIRQEIAHTGAINANTIAQYANNMAMTKANIGAISLLTRIEKLKVAFSSMGKAGWIGLVLSAIAAVAVKIATTENEAGKLKRKLDEISDTTIKETRGAAAGYQLLVDKLKAVNDKYGETANQTKEYADIVKQINTSYGQYLTNLFDEAEAYDNIAASVKMVTQAIIEKKRNEQYEKSVSAIDKEYSDLLNDAKSNIASEIESVYGVGSRDAKKMAEAIADMVQKGIDAEEAVKHMADSFGKAYKTLTFERHDYTYGVSGERIVEFNVVNDYKKLLEQRDKAIENLLHEMSDPVPYKRELDKIDESFSKQIESAANDVKKLREIELKKKEAYLSVYEDKGLSNSAYADKLRSEIASLKKWGGQWIVVAEQVRDKVYADNKRNEHGRVTEKFLESLLPNETDVDKGMLSSYIEKLAEQWNSVNEQLDKEVARKTDISTESDLLSIRRLKDQKQYIEEFIKAVGLSVDIFKKKSSSRTGDSKKDLTLEGIKERLALMKTAYMEYKKWVDLVGDDEASRRIEDSGLFSVLGKDGVPKSLDDYRNKVKNIYIDLQEAIQKETSKERRDTLRSVLKQLLDTDYDIMKDVYLAEIESMRNYLKEYGSFEQKKLAITEEYEDKIRKAQTKGQKLTLQKERDKALSQLSFQNVTAGIDWRALFGGVNSLGKNMAGPLLDKLKAFMQTEDYQNSDTQTKKDLAELIKELRKYVGTDDSVTWRSLDSAIRNFTKSVDVYNKAVDSEKEAVRRRDEAKVKLDRGEISKDEYRRLSEEADKFGMATANARINMDNLAQAVNSTTDEIVNYTSKLSAVLNNASSWSGVDGFSNLKQSIGDIDKFVGAISSALPSMKEGGNKEFSSKILSSIQGGLKSVGNGLEKVLSSGLGQVIGLVAQIPRLILNLASTLKNMVTGILDSFTELISLRWIDDVVVGIMNSLSGLVNSVFDLPENLFKTIESAWVDGIGGFANTFFGRVGNILSFGLLSSKGPADWFKNSNAAEVAETQQRLEESNKILATSIDDLRDEISKRSGVSAISNSKRAKQYQEQYNKNLLDIAIAQAGYHGSHHSWSKYWSGFSQEQIARLSGQIGRDWDGDIWNLTPEEMKMLRSNADMWELIRNTGKGGYGERLSEKLDAYIEQAGKIEEIDKNLAESLTQITFDGLRSEFIDSLMDMDKSAQDFANDFEKYMMRAVLNAKISDILDSEIKEFYDTWAAFSESDGMLSEDEIEKLRRMWEAIINSGLAIRDDASKITGYEGDESSGSSLSKGVKGVTEETSGLLASYLNSVRADVSFKRTLQEKFFNQDFPKLSAIAQAQLTQLNAIAANTKRNAEFVEEIYNILNRNVRGANKFNV